MNKLIDNKEAWIKELTERNFLAFYDMLIEIKETFQLSKSIKLNISSSRPKRIFFETTAGGYDSYRKIRKEVLVKLKQKEIIIDGLFHKHSFNQVEHVTIDADETVIKKYVEIFKIEHDKRTSLLSTKSTTKKKINGKTPHKLPEKITLKWLWEHVPFNMWAMLITMFAIIFVLGVTLGQYQWIKDIVGIETVSTQDTSSKESK